MTAARLCRLAGHRPAPVELSVPAGRSPRPLPGALVHRVGDLVPADVETRRGIRCTTPARTILDLADRLPEAVLEAALDGAERDGLVWRPHLRWRLDQLRRRGRPGVARIEALLDRTEGRSLGGSWLEQQALRIITRARLPAPRCQVKLRRAGGGIARVDLFWDDARLVVELDGHGTHATRRQRQADAERAAALGLAGWRIVRFTYEDVVERPDYVVATIGAYLAAAA